MPALQIETEPSVQSSGEAALWGEVLCQVVRDLCSSPRTKDTRRWRRDALWWIGARPSRDFRAVCAMAGIDPDAAHPWFMRMAAMPWHEARAAVPQISYQKGGRWRE